MKISALGPTGSFSELAAINFLNNSLKKGDEFAKDGEIVLYPSISRAIDAIGTETDLGVIPIENMIEGYVSSTVDRLVYEDLRVVAEIYMPVDFSFVANTVSPNNVKRAYIQFVTQGQCVDYISKLPKDVQIITTDSNSQSYELVINGDEEEGAIIPIHMGLSSGDKFKFSENYIGDSSANMTRFFVISKKDKEIRIEGNERKTSIMVTETKRDEPGTLVNILLEFKSRGINLSSITSRPNKKVFGGYYFYMDLDGDYITSKSMQEAIEAIKTFNHVLVLGSYLKMELTT